MSAEGGSASVCLQPGDVFLTKGPGLLSRLIRFFTRSVGERRTKVNHVGLVVQGGDLQTAVVVEALIKVREHPLWSQYGPPAKDAVAVYRPTDLTPKQVALVVAKARSYVGRDYGYLKIAAHFLDWALLGAHVFRRLAGSDRYPICSWVVAFAFEEVRSKFFGVDPAEADPDDIWDYVQGRADFGVVCALAPVTAQALSAAVLSPTVTRGPQ